jgi:hypothetical protein
MTSLLAVAVSVALAGLAAAAPEPTSRADLRDDLKRLGLEPRSQGSRNTCSVFVTTEALEFALARERGEGRRLSPEYLNWACNQVIDNRTDDRGQFFQDLLRGFERFGICYEEDMPYVDPFDSALQPSPKAVEHAEAMRTRGFRWQWIKRWERNSIGLSDGELDLVKATLAKGWPVAAGASHSRLLVGYRVDPDQPGGGVFIARDSGSGRDEEITFAFVKDNIADAFWVELPRPRP